MRVVRQGAVVLAALAFPLIASAQWEENFDSYSDGDCLLDRGLGGWEGFCGRLRDMCVTSAERISRPNGLRTGFGSIVQPIDLGGEKKFRLAVWLKIPNKEEHQDLFIRGYNEYDADACTATRTIDAVFSFEGKVRDGIRRFEDVDIQYGDWKELRVDVDIQANTLNMFYDGRKVSEGVYNVFGGPDDLVAFHMSASSDSFIDDISLTVPPTCRYENTKVKKKKCRVSKCPAKVEGCETTNDAICGSVEDCKKKITRKLPCNDPEEKGKCLAKFVRCDCSN
ncbi:MAG: hypothetical protein C4547_10055 [Phycisphaerales bacterium]|nr:MAG: hypothetical protein C4547_10055 [Phycisphaerales bacterium]